MSRVCWGIVLSVITTGVLFGEEIPKGEVIQKTFSDSKIFPGTVRDYWVYIPQQYDPEKPACLHVNQDGVQFNAPEVLDELIHKKEIPVMIGLFVMHGKVPAPHGDALDRFNRSFEYDGLGDEYVRFILEEMIPEVEKLTASDGRPIKLSKSGNDRSIGGTSSGAICSFTAAWERPEEFSRVYSGIGTYVGLRGGDRYHTLVRKTEPKAIRFFLQDGSNDLNIYGGDWWMANQTLERALTFAGYEVEHVWDEGKHSNVEPTKQFPAAMKSIWKEWPTPVKKGLGSPQLQAILMPDNDWELVSEGYGFTEGPTANEKGEVFFTDVPKSTSHKVGLDGKTEVFRDATNRGNGQVVGPDGRLYMVASGTEEIVAIDAEGKSSVVAKGFAGNDIAVRHDGGLYVTNPVRPPENDSKVWFIPKGGEPRVVDSGLKFPNGVCLSPDQTLLYVADSRTHWVYSYQIQSDGSLKHKQRYYHLHVPDTADDSAADGMACDVDGRLYVTTRMGIQVCDQAGRVNCILPTPNGKVSNVCFGGPNFDVLYATCGDKVYRRQLKVQGVQDWKPALKPEAPRL